MDSPYEYLIKHMQEISKNQEILRKIKIEILEKSNVSEVTIYKKLEEIGIKLDEFTPKIANCSLNNQFLSESDNIIIAKRNSEFNENFEKLKALKLLWYINNNG